MKLIFIATLAAAVLTNFCSAGINGMFNGIGNTGGGINGQNNGIGNVDFSDDRLLSQPQGAARKKVNRASVIQALPKKLSEAQPGPDRVRGAVRRPNKQRSRPSLRNLYSYMQRLRSMLFDRLRFFGNRRSNRFNRFNRFGRFDKTKYGPSTYQYWVNKYAPRYRDY